MLRAETQEKLRADYVAMRHLTNLTPQLRGQQFNSWLAALLRAYGINAKENQRSAGEIDVVFSIGETRYILEAKWSKTKSDTGQLAKLQKRVRQRLSGTYGVFVAMAGYTDEALGDLIQGDRLELILLDREHVEAMLSGAIGPQELLSKLRDEASFAGRPYTPMSAVHSGADEGVRAKSEGKLSTEPRLGASGDGHRVPWDPRQPWRGNPAGQYVAFEGHQRMYWGCVALLLCAAIVMTVAVISDHSAWRIVWAGVVVVEVVLIVGFWRLAMRPVRLEVGSSGIQAFFPKDNAWMPWDRIDRVDVARVDGSLAIVAWSRYAKNFPTAGETGIGAHYVPSFDAVAICPLGPLRAKRHEVVRALEFYGHNRY
ncbi:restriction endonuclease [Nocardia vulneris]|nr:restriction endonuclease [Nocardia vulneris]